ncbi:acyl carrier protein [Clostridium sp. AF18-27]|uniref:acyl carrier protein n=1 Tax=Enterocloster lavalensis TaxID=460384 RepID=UPI000E499A97|nr:acyl carrier protein [Enterocloster lavalensis]RHR51862.1 acyl carrier protein [Clostridium sp. AF18-27]
MTEKEKLALLEETLEEDAGTLTRETVLDDLDSWDSMAKLSLIVLMDDQFSKTLSGNTIKGFVTIGDIIDYMS